MELAGRSRKGQLKQADRIGARYVALVSSEGTALKDMQAGEQRDVTAGEVVARILRGRGLP
jgi:histidyl-tRNA synthetase